MNNRLFVFDNAKLVLIILVVIGHLLDVCAIDHRMAKAAFVFIYSFHMPLFIFISGLFMNREKLTATKARNRILYLVTLGFIAKFILRIVPSLFGKPITFSLLSDGGVPWFMFAMAAFCTLTYLLRNANNYVVLGISIVLSLFVGYDKNVGDYLYLSRIIVFFPFFWYGVMLEPKRVAELVKKPPVRVVGVLIVVAIAVFCIAQTGYAYHYRGLFTGRNCYESINGIEACSWANRLIAYVISALMCFGVLCMTPQSKIPFVSSAGQRTLQIYLLHYPLIYVLQYTGLLTLMVGLPNGWLLCFPLGVAIALLVSPQWLEVPLKALNRALMNWPSAPYSSG